MAYFPLFTDSRTLKCLVVGGGLVGLRKLRTLTRFDVDCSVVANEFHDELLEFAQSHGIATSKKTFSESDLSGFNLVVVATSSSRTNERISQLCHQRSIAVNVVDNAELSSIIFPAIVDRKPVTIAISSDGLSPTITRRLRTQIEAIVSNSIGILTEYIGNKRKEFQRASTYSPKKWFWDSVLDSNLPNLLSRGEIAAADDLFDNLKNEAKRKGFVSLVGAGPGDPDLLTIKALNAMQKADVVYYDNLVSDDIRSMVRRDARQIYVGKKRGFKSIRQEEISRMLLADAKAGLHVVRLKGGDPMLFGRGGEETEHLGTHLIDYEVIPGVTAALGCAAYAGIPLTHRDYAQSVRFVTGHLRSDESNLDWPELAKPDQTLVVYMGLVGLRRFTANLIEHALPGDTPVAVVSRGTLPDQQIVAGTLENIAQKVEEAAVPGPTTTIIGNVVHAAVHLRTSVE